ncbi:MAG: hypothetical protein F4W96_08855 [Chloroflexi bacterium]|nr:hypothetical protein [Chloroflexota bacterium]
MPNPFHLRANIDRLWRRSGDHNPGYVRVAALDAIVRELFAPTERARANHQLYLATDPFDVARHKLRDLYDRAALSAPHTIRSRPRAGGGRPRRGRTTRTGRRPLVTAPAQRDRFFSFSSPPTNWVYRA